MPELPLTRVCVDSSEATSTHEFIMSHGCGWYDEAPKLLEQPPTSVADSLLAAVSDSTALVRVLVDTSGRVIVATVLHGSPELRQPALDVACGCVFKPARARGIPVPLAIVIPLRFVPSPSN